MATDSILSNSLDDYFQSSAIGSIDKAVGNNLFGINHRQIKTAVPSNKDTYGLTFFTRPQLNMQTDNIRNFRLFYPLLTSNDRTIQRFVRATLDPRLLAGYSFGRGGKNKIPAITCPLVDNNNPFISVFTNNLLSISGWTDMTLDTFDSKPGLYKEVYTQVDSFSRVFGVNDITATFRSTRGDPIMSILYVWMHYMSNVFEGRLLPYFDFITENEKDYESRIYRLVLDSTKQEVTKIASTIAYPVSNPLGAFFDFNSDQVYNDQNKEITVRFKCSGIEYMDDAIIYDFNQTVVIFNEAMSDSNRGRYMKKVDKELLYLFNNRGYPRINTNNNELEWYVSIDLFKNVNRTYVKMLNNKNNVDTDNTEIVFTGE